MLLTTHIMLMSDVVNTRACKVRIFREGHKLLRNLPLTFDYSTYSQKQGEDFAKFCGLLIIYELYLTHVLCALEYKCCSI